jgi:hypothetical protein
VLKSCQEISDASRWLIGIDVIHRPPPPIGLDTSHRLDSLTLYLHSYKADGIRDHHLRLLGTRRTPGSSNEVSMHIGGRQTVYQKMGAHWPVGGLPRFDGQLRFPIYPNTVPSSIPSRRWDRQRRHPPLLIYPRGTAPHIPSRMHDTPPPNTLQEAPLTQCLDGRWRNQISA